MDGERRLDPVAAPVMAVDAAIAWSSAAVRTCTKKMESPDLLVAACSPVQQRHLHDLHQILSRVDLVSAEDLEVQMRSDFGCLEANAER